MTVVCNSLQSGHWGAEERQHNAPLPQGGAFNITITVRSHVYQVTMNGQLLLEFRHRIPFHRVDTIKVGGAVEVSSISFMSPAPAPSFMAPSVAFPSFGAFPTGPAFPGFPPQPVYPPAMPVVPYHSVISGGLMPGRSITIQGVVTPHAD
ncbi:galectin-4-like, partial [Eucyclogobius newberryi]